MNLDAEASPSAVKQRRSLSGSEAGDMAEIKDAAGLRVVALAAEAFGGYGGIAQSTRDLMLAVSSIEAIASIDILPRHARDHVGELSEKIAQHPPRPGRLSYMAHACRLMASVRPHILYCGHLYMAPLAAALARLHNAKLVVHLHGLELWKPITQLRQLGLSQADLALCVSHDTKDRLLRASGLSADWIEVIYNTYEGVFVLGDREKARQTFGLQGETVLLTVSRLDGRQRHKGHDVVIPLISRLRARGHDVLYFIAGDGDDTPRLEALAREHGVANQVRFLGRVSLEQLPDLYRAADLYVMPSTGEGFGIAFIEAMACGTPALGLAVGGATDALGHGELGTAASLDAFPDALSKALDNTGRDRNQLASAVKKRFGRKVFHERVHAAFEPIIAKWHRGGHPGN